MRLKIDLHVHTIFSADSVVTCEALVSYARKQTLNGVAVTDHDRLDSALKMSREADVLVVPGMEISSSDGHIVALDIQEPIPKGLSAVETVDRVHGAGGIAIACHPSTLFKGSLGRHATSSFDAIEVINSSAIPFSYSRRGSERIASGLRIARVAGSDAHYGPEIGYAYTLIDAEPNVDSIINAIKRGMCQPFGNAIPITMRLRREIAVFLKRSRLVGKNLGEIGDRSARENLGQVTVRPCTRA